MTAYLADMSEYLNGFDLNLYRNYINYFFMEDKIAAITKKVWYSSKTGWNKTFSLIF